MSLCPLNCIGLAIGYGFVPAQSRALLQLNNSENIKKWAIDSEWGPKTANSFLTRRQRKEEKAVDLSLAGAHSAHPSEIA